AEGMKTMARTLDEWIACRRARFYGDFLAKSGRPADTPLFDCDHFEATERGAHALLRLVLAGRKRVTSSALPAFAARGEKLPEPGALSLITDFYGRPGCVIETETVTVVPFSNVTAELAASEGEGDTLESWRASHRRFFEADGRANGYVFYEDMPVVFETFRVVYPEEEPRAAVDPRAEETVRAFAARLNGLLDGALESVYLTGSAAYGDFHPGYSDLDFFFISRRPLARTDFEKAHALYAEYRAKNDGWFSVLEGDVVHRDALASGEGGTLYWGTSRDRFKPRCDLSGYSLRSFLAHGVLLEGTEQRAWIPWPEEAVIRAQARHMCDTVRDYAGQAGENAHYADWLLLLSQTLYTLITGNTTGKTAATRWLYAHVEDAALKTALAAALDVRFHPEIYRKSLGETFTKPMQRLREDIAALL
ncbi:MAG: ASCH domain-containing protein, partial [Clostridia bacterium]|nr:ASCH domain-containing protein [Clostridia bacterium]